MPSITDDRVLVGFESCDDAGVYKISDDLALVQTVDFFTPIVDDPFDFGRIAAANALSDIYAMGATPLTALNIAAFPSTELPMEILGDILRGGAAITEQAGVRILGGHTVKDAEPKYGLAVTGTIDPRRLVTNAGARSGDILVLTKPLGTGVLATALKRGSVEEIGEAIRWMTTLNDRASAAMVEADAHGATDITGYGLLGHANELARASRVRLTIDSACVPLMTGVLKAIAYGDVPGGTRENAAAHAGFTTFSTAVSEELRLAFSDAQTSGGLLISLARERLPLLQAHLDGSSSLCAVIGEVGDGEGIYVR